MSLYNMIHGVNPCTFFILPMLGKHPDEYPRFRDCFTKDEEHPEYDGHIHVYTRTGGGNRESYGDENEEMQSMETFVADFDDSFDCTFASWVFSVPEKWKADFDKIEAGVIREVSAEYQAELRRVYPKLEAKFDEIFSVNSQADQP
jgi:hypothetical protein